MTISTRLYNCLRKWREQTNKEFPLTIILEYGLCANVYILGGPKAHYDLIDEFVFDGMDTVNPFYNTPDEYLDDLRKHKHAPRREWVDKKIAEYEAARNED